MAARMDRELGVALHHWYSIKFDRSYAVKAELIDF